MAKPLSFICLLIGCFGSHELDALRDADLFPTRDADLFPVRDAGTDAVFADVHPPDTMLVDEVDAAGELIFDVPAHFLHGARWGVSTSLVVSFGGRSEAPIEVWTFDRVGANLPATGIELSGTSGARAAAAARWDDLLAVAVERGPRDGAHEVLLVDLRSGTTIARFVVDPTLMRPRVFHAFVAMNETQLLVIWLDPESVTRHRVVSFDAGVIRDISSGFAGTNSLSAAVRLAREDPVIAQILRDQLGTAFDIVDEQPERPWVGDGPSVAAFDRGSLHVDDVVRSADAPAITTMYGRMTYARSGGTGLIAMATGSGLLAASIDPEIVTWRDSIGRFPAGSPVAHVGSVDRGFFFVEGALGLEPARLRWVGL